MKKLLPLFALALTLAIESRADDRLRDVQSALQTQGFYYGDINGQDSPETGAAIKRYQIRNGLEVTGTLTDETVKSLGIGGAAPAPPVAAPKPAQNLRRDPSVENSDKNFLRREEAKQRASTPAPQIEDDPSAVPPPRMPNAPSPDLADFFAGTPYANAPAVVQGSTLRRAQSFLASRGIYRDPIDGAPGPATEESILNYQRSVRLPLTGRLDLETLSAMRLLPGRPSAPLRGFVPDDRQLSGQRVYRGIWVH